MWCCLTLSCTWWVLVRDFHCLCCCGCVYITLPPPKSAPIPSSPLISHIFPKRLPQFPLTGWNKRWATKPMEVNKTEQSLCMEKKIIDLKGVLKDYCTFITVASRLCESLFKETNWATDLTEGHFILHKHIMWQSKSQVIIWFILLFIITVNIFRSKIFVADPQATWC